MCVASTLQHLETSLALALALTLALTLALALPINTCLLTSPNHSPQSSLLQAVTDTKSEVAAYEFTTLTCIPGNVTINDIKIQLLDLPGIIEGAASGKGRGK
jgi:GTPase involved in cell partitioning and DNA repair